MRATILVLLLMTGCTVRLGDFTILSPKNIDVSRLGELKRGPRRVLASDVGTTLLGIPLRWPSVEAAADDAIELVPGAVALVDAVVEFEWVDVFLLGRYTFYVEGTPLIDPDLVPSTAPAETAARR